MFNDQCGLTKAVLEGRKTMTRRIIPEMVGRQFKKKPHIAWDRDCFLVFKDEEDIEPILLYPRYMPGEVVAVAQRYSELSWDSRFYKRLRSMCERLPKYELAGWDNKMFVRADLMPLQIRITNVRVERLQDISDDDCLREGIVKACGLYGCEGVCERGDQLFFSNPREAFAALIDKISGKGTWKDNPYVFAYEFELVK